MLQLCFQRTRFGTFLVNGGVMLRRTRFGRSIGIFWSYAS